MIGFMRFWTCLEALDLDYRHEKRVFNLGHWLARYCILKIEYIIVSYIIILRYGSIGGTSTFALRLMLLPPLPLPIWYAWLGDDILHPVIGFLHFWICLKAFMCAIYVPIFRRIYFILVWRIFLYGFI